MKRAKDKSFIFNATRSVKGIKLKVSPNRRYFVNQYGEPFFYLGDTAWTLFKRLNHEEVDEYLKNRAAKGFTVIQAYVLRGLEVPNLYGDLTLIDEDPTKPNAAFFENIDYIVNRAEELGLFMAMVTTFGEHVKQGIGTSISENFRKNEAIFNTSNAYIYGKFLGNRYKDKPVIWLLGGDRKPVGDEVIWRAMAEGLIEGHQGNHLISYHGPGDETTPSSSFWFHNDSWLNFNTIQSGHGWAIKNYEYVTRDYNLKPIKPTLDMEARYENLPDVKGKTDRRIDAHQVREAAYWAALAGAAGHGYGCNDIWQFFDEERKPSYDDYSYPTEKLKLTGTINWHEAMDSGGAYGVGLMRKLFELRPWYKMVPDQSVIAAGQGEGEDHIQVARAEDGSFIIAYSTFGNPFSIRMDKNSGTKVKAQWYNPRNGTWTDIGQYSNTGVLEFNPPSSGDRNDWVLVLEDTGKNYPVDLPK